MPSREWNPVCLTASQPEIRWILLRFAVPFWIMLYPYKLCCTLMSYDVPLWVMLYPYELCCTLWAILYHCELRCTLMSYATLVSYAVPLWAMLYEYPMSYAILLWAMLYPYELGYAVTLWAMLYPSELQCCTLLNYAAFCQWTLHPAELRLTLLLKLSYVLPSYAVPYCASSLLWATLLPSKLRSKLLSYTAPWLSRQPL